MIPPDSEKGTGMLQESEPIHHTGLTLTDMGFFGGPDTGTDATENGHFVNVNDGTLDSFDLICGLWSSSDNNNEINKRNIRAVGKLLYNKMGEIQEKLERIEKHLIPKEEEPVTTHTSTSGVCADCGHNIFNFPLEGEPYCDKCGCKTIKWFNGEKAKEEQNDV